MLPNGFLRILIFLLPFGLFADSWENAQSRKQAQLDLYWYTSVPFIYEDPNGNLTGIEFEIMNSFREYLLDRHEIIVTMNWIQAPSFSGIMKQVADTSNTDQLGVSAFSITESRKDILTFSDPYLPDITVLITSSGTPIAEDYGEINEMLKDMDAVTIKGTSYVDLLEDLRNQLNIDFETRFIESDQNILNDISKAPDRFGFIDLPIYLMLIKNGGDLTRQNLFTYQGTGYGFIMSKNSDWYVPFNQFLQDPQYKKQVAAIISDYLGDELFEFIDRLYSGSQQLGTSILTKEKELQLALIRNANLKLEEEKSFKNVLILGISISILFLLIIVVLFVNNQRTTRQLIHQKDQIEDQQEDIRKKNEQLMNRNTQLLAINEERNNLVRILAHDLRSPLGQIMGASDLLNRSNEKLDEEERELFKQINTSSHRIREMINRILHEDVMDGSKNLVLKERVDIREITQELARRFRPIAARKNIDLELMQCRGHFMLETDHLLLFQVLENLLSNAIKFSEEQTVVSFEADCNPDRVLFKISDQGPGFTEEDKAQLFSRFQKLSAKPTAGESSTGLGLSIVKKYVTELGGKIWLESNVGAGSTFFVSLPR
jgi:signal transduction histidine kinase/ABC-type amino acid transport substrate-binding protein